MSTDELKEYYIKNKKTQQKEMITDNISFYKWQTFDPFNKFLEPLQQIPFDNEINTFGFRSDEFTTNHKGKHILFTGCSVTYGVGLEKREIWASQVYNKIKKNEECSGFFNLGSGGTGIIHMIRNLFLYFNQYGNPDIIFMNLSNQCRSTYYNEKKLEYNSICFDNKHLNNMLLENYFYYLLLEQYCKTNKIKLYSFSWDYNDNNIKNNVLNTKTLSTNDIFKHFNFETFYQTKKEDVISFMSDLLIKINDSTKKVNFDKQYFDIARDNLHQGTGFHIYWANFIYNKYLENNDNSRN